MSVLSLPDAPTEPAIPAAFRSASTGDDPATADGSDRRLTLALALASNVFAAVTSTLLAAYLPDTVRDLVGGAGAVDVGRIGAYVGALFLVGWAVGGVGLGWAGDRVGRVRAFALAVALTGAGTLAAAWSPTWPALVACRFVTGMGVGGTLVVSTILVAEAWPGRARAVVLGVLAVSYPIGIIAAGAVSYAVADWRTAFLIGVAPLALAAVAAVCLRDSAAWTIGRGAPRRAGSTFGDVWAPAHRGNFLVGATIFGAMLVGLWATFSWLPTWAQSLVGDGPGGQQTRGLLMMLLGMGGIVGGAVSGVVANAVGRRHSLLIAFGGCTVASGVLFGTNATFTPVVYAETAALALFFGLSQGVLSAYIPELFPAAIRSTATGLCFNLGRLVTAAAVFAVGALVGAFGGYGNAVLAFSLAYVLGFVATWYGRETSASAEPLL